MSCDLTPRASGEPCSHRGCIGHRTHPCEGCGRFGAQGEYRPGDWFKIVEPWFDIALDKKPKKRRVKA